MFWKVFWKMIASLLIIALFVGGGYAIYRGGFSQGVVAGVEMTEGAGEVDNRSFLPHGGPYVRPYRRPFMVFPFFGLMIGFFLLMMFFGGIRHLTHYRMWKSAGNPCDEDWKSHWSGHHRHPYWRSYSRKAPSEEDDVDESADEVGD